MHKRSLSLWGFLTITTGDIQGLHDCLITPSSSNRLVSSFKKRVFEGGDKAVA
jgi:hypothetical protein